MQSIIDKARALWEAIKSAWDKLRGREEQSKNDSGGGGGPGPVK